MQLGTLKLSTVSDGRFWLDGGAMFGIVPKPLWSKLNPADEYNRIELGLNSLLIQASEKRILVDTGIGEKFDEKLREIYRVEKNTNLIDSLGKVGVTREDVDFVINTHLHFDHCGGNTLKDGEKFVPTFPKAKYVIQKKEWFDATHVNERTRGSYLTENFIPIEEAGQLILADGDIEITPGISVIVTGGHTRGHQSVMLASESKKAIYLGDLIPTTSHIKIPYIMGYDLYPLDVIEKKKQILDQALKENWLLIFEHDPRIAFAYLVEENGRPKLKLGNYNDEKL
ncbi:MAG: MBL fold metallo-hydrolase [candidate division WOR-3 bacterium]|nr:MAG: MBL fold metallo-hydrolase [candidate division WOR-3 bacterium]